MSDDNDSPRNGNGGPGDGNGPDDKTGDPRDPKVLRERMERAASRVIHEKLGKELDEDGKVDFSSITQSEMEGNAQELIFGFLNAFGSEVKKVNAELKKAGKKTSPPEAFTVAPLQPGEESPSQKEPATPTAKEAGPTDEAPGGSSRGESADGPNSAIEIALDALGKRIQSSLSAQLEKQIGISLEKLQQADLDSLEKGAFTQQITGKLGTWTQALGELVQKAMSTPQLAQLAGVKPTLQPGGSDAGSTEPLPGDSSGPAQVAEGTRVSAIPTETGPKDATTPASLVGTHAGSGVPAGESSQETASLEGHQGQGNGAVEIMVDTPSDAGEAMAAAISDVHQATTDATAAAGDAAAAATLEAGEEGAQGPAEEGPGKDKPQDNVIDLESWRKRLETKSDTSAAFKFGESLQEALSRILGKDFSQKTLQQGGSMNLHIDENFMRDHGATLLASVLKDIAKNLVPPKVELTLPMTDGEKAHTPLIDADARPAAPTDEDGAEPSADEQPDQAQPPGADSEADPGIKVSVKLDFGSLLAGFIKKPEPPQEDS